MAETKNPGDKLTVSSTKTLTLKRGGVEQGVVRQSFSHSIVLISQRHCPRLGT